MGVVNQNAQSSTGTCTVTASAAPMVTWNLTYLSISQAGPTSGTNSKVTVYDGSVASGTVIFAAFIGGPEAMVGVGISIGSVGTIKEIPIPKDARGLPALQATPGNAMNVQVTGTGANAVSINARFSDGLS